MPGAQRTIMMDERNQFNETTINTFFGSWPKELHDPSLPNEVMYLENVSLMSKGMWMRIGAVHEEAVADLSLSDLGKQTRSADAVAKCLTEVRTAHVKASHTAKVRMEAISQKLRKRLEPGDAAMEVRAAENRSVLRTMTPEERRGAARAAFQDQDERLMHAIAGGSPLLLDLPQAELDNYQRKFLEHAAPGEMFAVTALTLAMERADKAVSSLEAHTARLLGSTGSGDAHSFVGTGA